MVYTEVIALFCAPMNLTLTIREASVPLSKQLEICHAYFVFISGTFPHHMVLS